MKNKIKKDLVDHQIHLLPLWINLECYHLNDNLDPTYQNISAHNFNFLQSLNLSQYQVTNP